MTTYVTVAIPFVNADPHLGYAYELLQADIFARSRRAAGEPTRFVGGTDDFSLKNVLAAELAGASTDRFVADHADRFQSLGDPLDISFDDFLRTSSDPRHPPAVERLWRACQANGDLYRRSYEGDYCVGCEQFYEPADLIDGHCPEHSAPVEHVVEENWFFRLSAYADHLDRLIASGEMAIEPAPFREEVLGFIRGGLNDISVSRSVERARGWGLGVPDDPTQVIYVWFDALTNYISSLGFGDPDSADFITWWLAADRRIHVIGKGIVRFHAVFWPAFLASAGLPPPTQIRVHPYLTLDGAKLSKSAGNSIDPVAVVSQFGIDALRWWCARDVSSTTDTDFTIERLVRRANEDLANGLGNVVNRIVTLVHRTRGGHVPSTRASPIASTIGLDHTVSALLGEFDLRGATSAINDGVATVNVEIERSAPWTLPADLDVLLDQFVCTLLLIAGAAAPIVPDLSARLIRQLTPRGDLDGRLPEPQPAFSRIERP